MLKQDFKEKLKMEVKREITDREIYYIEKNHSLSSISDENTRSKYKKSSRKYLHEIYEQFKLTILEDETIDQETKVKILEENVLKNLLEKFTLDITYNSGQKENPVYILAFLTLLILNVGGVLYELLPHFRLFRSLGYINIILIPVFIYLIFKFRERNQTLAILEIRLAQVEFNEWVERVDSYLDEVVSAIKCGVLNESKKDK